MNALIQELAHMAASRTGVNLMAQDPKFVAALAKLIVAECMTVCESATQEGQPLHLVSLGYSQRLKDHFGVE